MNSPSRLHRTWRRNKTTSEDDSTRWHAAQQGGGGGERNLSLFVIRYVLGTGCILQMQLMTRLRTSTRTYWSKRWHFAACWYIFSETDSCWWNYRLLDMKKLAHHWINDQDSCSYLSDATQSECISICQYIQSIYLCVCSRVVLRTRSFPRALFQCARGASCEGLFQSTGKWKPHADTMTPRTHDKRLLKETGHLRLKQISEGESAVWRGGRAGWRVGIRAQNFPQFTIQALQPQRPLAGRRRPR